MRRSIPRETAMNDNATSERTSGPRYSSHYKPQYGASRVTGVRAGGMIWNVPFTCRRRIFDFDGFRWTACAWCKECAEKQCICKDAVADVQTNKGSIVVPDVPPDKLTEGERKTLQRIAEDKGYAERVVIVNPDRIGYAAKLTASKRRS